MDGRRVGACLAAMGVFGPYALVAWDASTSILFVAETARQIERLERFVAAMKAGCLSQALVTVAFETPGGGPAAPGMSMLTTSGVASACEWRIAGGEEEVVDAAIKVRSVVLADGHALALDLDAIFRLPGSAGGRAGGPGPTSASAAVARRRGVGPILGSMRTRAGPVLPPVAPHHGIPQGGGVGSSIRRPGSLRPGIGGTSLTGDGGFG